MTKDRFGRNSKAIGSHSSYTLGLPEIGIHHPETSKFVFVFDQDNWIKLNAFSGRMISAIAEANLDMAVETAAHVCAHLNWTMSRSQERRVGKEGVST